MTKYTLAGWLGTALFLWTRQADTAAEWQYFTVWHRISWWRPVDSLVPTLSASSWQWGSGGGTLWDVTLLLKTP